jgi:predicted RNase H-like HicB family nuclease
MMSNTNISRAEKLAHYTAQPYTINILAYECDGQLAYLASHPELYGCIAQGSTPAEAMRRLHARRPIYLATLLDLGVDIPAPRGNGSHAGSGEPGKNSQHSGAPAGSDTLHVDWVAWP